MKIVIVEDEIRIREGLVKLVRRLDQNYQVTGEAENGREGLELIERLRPDVIITDVRMPEMDGLEMLTALQKKNIGGKVIVLSAYSEFEYARTAMRMGVKEYLLKPVAVGDIADALHRAEDEINRENSTEGDLFESPEQIFGGILAGTLEADERMSRKLAACCRIPEKSAYKEICLYLGNRFETEKERAREQMENLLARRKGMEYLMVELEQARALLVLIYADENGDDLERWVQYWLLKDRSRKIRCAVGFISDIKLEEIRVGTEKLLEHMDWNISLGDDVMISYPKITKLQTGLCVYPLDIEQEMKLGVWSGEQGKIREDFQKFREYFTKSKVYDPKEIKECYVRFIWAFMNTAVEVGILRGEKLEQQKLLEQISRAKTMEELTQAENSLLEGMEKEKEEILHLTVKRAQGMIQEFYQTGITLEEIAAKLNITPEYLGTRFHQEMGVTFSAYIRDCRIKKAKELLLGTGLKLYEIAEKVGYADPKYFSRVFRDVTGQLPADYRKTHK